MAETQLVQSDFRFTRHFTKPDVDPYDEIEWELRDATITDAKGNIVFQQKGVEVPKFWSQTATNIAVSKYFRGKMGTPARERSAKQMVGRVSKTIAEFGRRGGYFHDEAEAQIFEQELRWILINQYMAFNSPVWFNVGIDEKPQCSACFINSVKDDMRSILNLAVTEGMLFKYGSGTGTNLSVLRSSKELLSSGGRASGPVSFMKGFDSFAGVIKSGGKTRRAAKMVILNADHPDVKEFIWCKAKEEKKAWALIDAGYDGSIDGDAYGTVHFQNANHSVRVTDEFMKAVENDEEWSTKFVKDGSVSETMKARELMGEMADAAWQCGDPGLQYDTTIQKWNPCSNSARINATNPCSEYVFLDDTACNLASLNLMKFRGADGSFDVEGYKKALEITISAQEFVVDFASYPTEMIDKNSHDFRPLGIGYANLGALLMAMGLPYDSDEGRNVAAALTSIMTGHTYTISALWAKKLGAFRRYKENEAPFLKVMNQHRDAAQKIAPNGVPADLHEEAQKCWDRALAVGKQYGYKNAQISVLAPTGTISFLMDCDTTGIEPDIALVKYKWLVGGGLIKIVNNTVPLALSRLGYSGKQVAEMMAYINEKDTIEGAPHLREEHLPVFDCAFKPQNGKRSIHYMGHVMMMAAAQPFVSGAISKTVNMPSETTPEEIAKTYVKGWKLGLKAIAIYRDGSKRSQPLTTSKQEISGGKEKIVERIVYRPVRRKLSDERQAITHKFSVGGQEGYVTAGLYDDGSPGELFIVMAKEGSTVSGLMDSFATAVSLALQYGVPLKVLVNKFAHTRFEPNGMTKNPNIRIAKSIVDYIFRWMALKFLPVEDQAALGVNVVEENGKEKQPIQTTLAPSVAPETPATKQTTTTPATTKTDEDVNGKTASVPIVFDEKAVTFDMQSDAPACDTCGSIMVRAGACYKCMNCGSTSGCG